MRSILSKVAGVAVDLRDVTIYIAEAAGLRIWIILIVIEDMLPIDVWKGFVPNVTSA